MANIGHGRSWEFTQVLWNIKLFQYINKKLQLRVVQPSPTTSFTLFSSKNAASFLIGSLPYFRYKTSNVKKMCIHELPCSLRISQKILKLSS